LEVFKAIKERRSVRNYKPEPVPKEDLTKILDAGRWAPSSGNTQPLELVVVEDQDTKDRLANAARGQRFVSQAPVVLVVCANVPRTTQRYGDRGRDLYIIQDTAAAVQNMNLMAYALGYATCWVGSFRDREVESIIDAPDYVKALAILPIGKPEKIPEAPPKRDLEEIIHRNGFSETRS